MAVTPVYVCACVRACLSGRGTPTLQVRLGDCVEVDATNSFDEDCVFVLLIREMFEDVEVREGRGAAGGQRWGKGAGGGQGGGRWEEGWVLLPLQVAAGRGGLLLGAQEPGPSCGSVARCGKAVRVRFGWCDGVLRVRGGP